MFLVARARHASRAFTLHMCSHPTQHHKHHIPTQHTTNRFVPLRYIQWLHTTPTMILLMAMMSSTSSVGLTGAVGADLVMVATGLAATWTDGLTQVGWCDCFRVLEGVVCVGLTVLTCVLEACVA